MGPASPLQGPLRGCGIRGDAGGAAAGKVMGTVPRGGGPSLADPGRTLCRSLALGRYQGMPRSCPAGILLFSLGFPLIQPGPGGSEHPLPLPGPAKAAGAHYSIGKEFGAAF